jgi:ech hydrogenase subunit D
MSGSHSFAASTIEAGTLLSEVDALRGADWRIVQVLCVAMQDGAEITYSFGKGLELRSLRIIAPADSPVPSVTSLYPGAFLYENEIRDLYGVRIERIRSDWEGKVLDVAGEKPFSKARIDAVSSEAGSR